MDRAPDSAEPLRLILRLVSRLKRRALRLLERPADARDVLRDAETFCDLAERATGRMRTFLREGGPPPVPSGDSSDGSDLEAARDAPLPLADGPPPTPPRPEEVDGPPPSEERTIAVVGGETVKVPGDVDVDSFTSCKAVAVPFPSRFFEERAECASGASLDEVRRPKPASASEKAPFLRCVSMSRLLEPSAVRARSHRRRSRARRPTPPTVVLSSDSESERAAEADAAALDGLKRDIMLGRVTPRVRLARFPTGDAGLKKLLEKSGTAAAYGADGELLAGDPLRAKIAEIKRSLVLSSDTDGERPRARSRSSSAREDASSSTGSASSLRLTRPTRKRFNVLGSDLDEEVRRTRLKKNNNDRSKGNSIMKTGKRSRKKEDTLYDMIVNGKPDIVENNNSADSDSNDSNSQMKSVQSKPAAEKSMLRFTSELLDDDSSSGVELSSKTNGDTSITEPSKHKMEGKKNKSDTSGSEEITRKKEKTKVLSNSDDEESNDNSRKSTKKNDSNAPVKDSSLRGSDSENSDIFKPKRKRKSKTSDESSEDISSSEKINTKKRRRIKNVSGEDSELSGSDNGSGSDGGADSSKRGRKNIRKVKRSGNLDEATRTAARKEKERIHRIAERQRLYNESMFDESARPDEVVKLEKVVLDFDPVSKQPIISVDRGLVEKLKPHQGNGIKFMWDACFESVKQIKESKGSGCILAHCMGLGKTLQVVTLVHTLMTHQKFTKVERVLVVCPLSTVLNWVNEFKMWLKFAKCKDDFEIYEISRYKQNYERSNKLKEWLEEGGVCVLGYDMFRNLSADNNKKFRKAQLSIFQRALVDPGPDLVVCDEGHLLKNEKTSLSQSMNRVKTLRRIVLTGTPLQNNLKEYYCMVQFVKPDLLGKYNEYLNRFVNPITNGQYTDSTEHDIRIMKRRSHVLHTMLDGAVQRRDYSVLAPFLPPKHEYVLFISLTEIQIKLYSHYMDNYSRRPQPDRKSTGFLFPDFQSLQRIWTHPLVLKANSERYEILQQKKREKEEEDSEGSLVDFIDDDESTTSDESTSEDQSDENSDDSDQRSKKKNKPKKNSHKRVTRATAAADGDDVVEVKVVEPPRLENPTEWWMSLCSEDELDDIRHSNKLTLLLDIIKMCDAIGDKLLVFSQSLYSLDLIEQFLWKIDEATQKGEENQKLSGHLGSWSPGLDYFRLDGSANCENRAIWCKLFNREDNPRARLFLISTRAGGLGINLVAANRVVIFDMSWNPSHDVQSIFRVYRFGQKKPCYIYRFLALGTMEEKIYERQVTKQAISKRVIDEQQIDRHYAESDLAELYTFCPIPEGQREVPKLPKDRLFADLLQQHDKMIYKYHEHDSLLENKEEETLTEEERKAAWEDYENEKTRPPSSFGGQILAGFQQQQHHLAMSALLQQDYPGLTEQQIASMVPAVLQQMYQNGDSVLSQQMYPGYDFNLMQKMNAMIQAQNSLLGFKYPQNPMMNPNLMLNPANMASGGGAGGTMSNFQQGWQQQQQLQLQRIQQQQAMQANLKYYAGGLGSRDTVDMAALQQRQRAMMLASNPTLPQRGRPPKQSSMMAMGSKLSLPLSTQSPIPPATISSDIVDLDSE